jgi:hypothetical protein
MTPAYSGIANGDWVVEDAMSRPDDDTDDTMRSIERSSVCEGVGGGCVRHEQRRYVLTRHPERRASLRPCAPCGGV